MKLLVALPVVESISFIQLSNSRLYTVNMAANNGGKLFQNVDFLKYITYNIKRWSFYENFVIERAYEVFLTLSIL